MRGRIFRRIVAVVAPLLHFSGLDRLLAGRRNFWVRHAWSLFAYSDVKRMVMLDKPWWIYHAIDDVEDFLTERGGKARVFEYGAGASTVWLASRASKVYSVEHDGGFVDVYSSSVGHDFCQPPGTKWVEGLLPTSPAAPVHPNALGMANTAAQVVSALA